MIAPVRSQPRFQGQHPPAHYGVSPVARFGQAKATAPLVGASSFIDSFNSDSTRQITTRRLRLSRNLHFGFSQSKPAKHFKVRHCLFDVGDVHLNNFEKLPFPDKQSGAKSREKFPKFLNKVYHYAKKNPKVDVKLVLNGDIIDIVDSWPEDTKTYDPLRLSSSGDLPTRDETVQKITSEILKVNREAVLQIRKLLELPNVTIIFKNGNHDRMFFESEEAKNIFLRAILPKSQKHQRHVLKNNRFQFHHGQYYYDEPSRTIIRHGHEADESCRDLNPGEFPLTPSEINDLLILKPMKHSFPNKLVEMGYSEEIAAEAKEALSTLEFIRPVGNVFKYLFAKFDDLYKSAKKTEKNGEWKNKTITELALNMYLEFCQNSAIPPEKLPAMIRKSWQKTLLKVSTQFSRTHAGIEYFMTRQAVIDSDKVKNDKNQIRSAIQFLEANELAQTGQVRHMLQGHTHVPLYTELEIAGSPNPILLLNPSTFKPTLLYDKKHPSILKPVYPGGHVQIESDNHGNSQVRILPEMLEAKAKKEAKDKLDD